MGIGQVLNAKRMNSVLQNRCLTVMEAKTKADLEQQVLRFTRELGFQTMTAMAVLDLPSGEAMFKVVDNTPVGYRDLYADIKRNGIDPVLQHCKRNSVPIAWSQATYFEAGQANMWEEQAPFGYRNGIAFALHLPQGRHFMLGLDRDQALPSDPVEANRLTSSVMMFTVYAHDAAIRLLLPPLADEPSTPTLTARELETLRWTLEGKTSWEVGRILGIAENTVVHHAQTATRKLQCANKHHAAVKALRLGLIR